MTALRESWRALWSSRLLVWAAGAGTVAVFGFGPVRNAFDPPGVTRGFGRLGDLLAAPAARWDGAWYLVIAHYGYRPDLGCVHGVADGVLPALSARVARDRLAGHTAGARRRAALDARARARALRHPQAHDARAHQRTPPRRPGACIRGGAAGGDAHGLCADGALLLRGLHGVALPRTVRRCLLERSPGPLGVGRHPRCARSCDAQHGHRAGAPGADDLPVRAARGPSAGASHSRPPRAGARATAYVASCCGSR